MDHYDGPWRETPATRGVPAFSDSGAHFTSVRVAVYQGRPTDAPAIDLNVLEVRPDGDEAFVEVGAKLRREEAIKIAHDLLEAAGRLSD